MSKDKLNVCVDFDGVLNEYKGWKGEAVLYNPRSNAKKFLQELEKDYNIIIFTTRDADNVKEWMDLYEMPYDKITNKKEGAIAYIDDRAIRFNGSYSNCLYDLKCFKTYWEDDITLLKNDEEFAEEVEEGDRFKKYDFGGGYAIRDNQVNGLPQIRLQFSDEAIFLCDFLNKIINENRILKRENRILKEINKGMD